MTQIVLPIEIIGLFYDFESSLIPVNKETYKYKYKYDMKQRCTSAKKIQQWYKKYKIDSKMPILFVTDFYENNLPKWYLIRLFMKFYPKADLYVYPDIATIKISGKEASRPNITRMWDVYVFMKSMSIESFVKVGW
jgi:hypothetical protein